MAAWWAGRRNSSQVRVPHRQMRISLEILWKYLGFVEAGGHPNPLATALYVIDRTLRRTNFLSPFLSAAPMGFIIQFIIRLFHSFFASALQSTRVHCAECTVGYWRRVYIFISMHSEFFQLFLHFSAHFFTRRCFFFLSSRFFTSTLEHVLYALNRIILPYLMAIQHEIRSF